jgi:hypothetical protein
MNAQPKIQTKPPATIDELLTQQAELEQRLIHAERGNATARTELASAIAESDAEAISAARQQIRRTAADIAELGTDLSAARAKVEEAQARARIQAQGNRLEVLVRLAGEMVKTCEALEKATVCWAITRKAAITAATAFETELAHCNIGFDPFLSVAMRMDARVELLFWLETDGTYGRCRSLDTPMQLRESRRASLGLAAKDFRTFTLRQARGQLGIPEA